MQDLNIDTALNQLENELGDIRTNLRDVESALDDAESTHQELVQMFKDLPEQSHKYEALVEAIRKVIEEFNKIPPF